MHRNGASRADSVPEFMAHRSITPLKDL